MAEDESSFGAHDGIPISGFKTVVDIATTRRRYLPEDDGNGIYLDITRAQGPEPVVVAYPENERTGETGDIFVWNPNNIVDIKGRQKDGTYQPLSFERAEEKASKANRFIDRIKAAAQAATPIYTSPLKPAQS